MLRLFILSSKSVRCESVESLEPTYLELTLQRMDIGERSELTTVGGVNCYSLLSVTLSETIVVLIKTLALKLK